MKNKASLEIKNKDGGAGKRQRNKDGGDGMKKELKALKPKDYFKKSRALRLAQ